MDGMTDSALLAAPALLDRPAVVGDARALDDLRAAHCGIRPWGGPAGSWTWGEVHAAAIELADRLDPSSRVCNLCATRIGFLVTWLAALRRGCLQLLPPSGGQADLTALLDEAPCTVVMDDDALLQTVAASRAARLVWQPLSTRALPAASTLAWTPDWDRVCVCLYTSGSTGQPQPQFKTLRQLALGARALAARLDPLVAGGLAAWRAIVCSVPPQHMFGFETSVLLPLVAGLPVLERRPLLPLDIHAAHDQCDGPVAWVATPLHLRALAQAGESLPHCRLALVSTMPLAPTLAAQVEALLPGPVVEIFGSTETGVLATRRTARDTGWQTIGDVRLEQDGDATLAWSSHFPSPYRLADQVTLASDGRFQLQGRHADLVKIGGRRASLAGLNLLLQDLPGLRDGVFYLPATQAATERLVLVHAGPLDRPRAEAWLRERMDPVFLPRAWLQVERLPRDANGKLPRAALDDLVARERAGAALDFEFRVAADHPALPGHFPGQPIVPGVLILDHVLQRLQAAGRRGVATLPRVKFLAPLLPDEVAQVRFQRKDDVFKFRVSTLRGGAAQLIAEGSARLEAAA